jgi:16S rRNA U1498 N3-methylase RsmE
MEINIIKVVMDTSIKIKETVTGILEVMEVAIMAAHQTESKMVIRITTIHRTKTIMDRFHTDMSHQHLHQQPHQVPQHTM